MFLRLQFALLVGLIVISVNVSAHDYWFDRAGDDYLLHRGHSYSQHGGEKEVPFEPEIITGTYCLNPGDTAPTSIPFSKGYPLQLKGPCLAIMVSADSGYWSQTLTGTKNESHDNLFGVLRSWQAVETVKRVDAWDERLLNPLSDGFELVFSEDPFSSAVGDKIRLIATLNGVPVEGVTVAYDADPRGVTGKQGRINLRIRHPGQQIITASIEKPLDDGKADKLVLSTALMFDID
jgi:nickel transport protein